MKIELDNNGLWAIFWINATILILSISIAVLVWSYKRDKVFVEHGYTRQTMQGSDFAEWVKENEK